MPSPRSINNRSCQTTATELRLDEETIRYRKPDTFAWNNRSLVFAIIVNVVGIVVGLVFVVLPFLDRHHGIASNLSQPISSTNGEFEAIWLAFRPGCAGISDFV